jgi:plastocyanin
VGFVQFVVRSWFAHGLHKRFDAAPGVAIMRLALALLALLAFAVAGCSGKDTAAPGTGASTSTTGGDAMMAPMAGEVMMMNNQFDPAEVTIHVGGSVHWVDHDSAMRHNIVSTTKGSEFRSNDMDATLPLHDREFTHKFDTAGTVDYLCEYHNGMAGKVIVVA